MKKNEKYFIDYLTETIILTKSFYKAAGSLDTPEYKTLMELRRQNPDYTIALREIKKAEDKKSYRNLTYENMETFIKKIEQDDEIRAERLAQFATTKELSKVQPGPYAYVKTWFLETYGEEYNKYRTNDKAAA